MRIFWIFLSCKTNGKTLSTTDRKIESDDESGNVRYVDVLKSTTYALVECQATNNGNGGKN